MRTTKTALLVVAALLAVACATATAMPGEASHRTQHATPFHQKYLHLYWKSVRRFGRRAPGRNIITRGVKTSSGTKRDPLRREIAKSIRQLRRLLHPAPPLLVGTAHPPAQPPAGVLSPGVAVGSAHMACIIRNESHGDPRATNGQYHGIGQWSPTSWATYGGTRYASDPINATYEQQLRVLASEGDAGMSQQQGQYDGCG